MKRAERLIGKVLAVCLFFCVWMSVALAGARPLTLEALAAPGEARYINPETGYGVYIEDTENLLTEEEEDLLILDMIPVTDYGSAAFVSDQWVQPEQVYRGYFGRDSGTVMVIDMGERLITIFSDGQIYKYVNKKYASLITDNTYSYASKGDYYGCASLAFYQIGTVLAGGRIAQPMRYITNALAAIVAALLGNFLFIWFKKKRIRIPKEALLAGAGAGLGAGARTVLNKTLVKTRKTRRSSSSGGSSGGGSGGGGFGGGGSSGGGGSHRF